MVFSITHTKISAVGDGADTSLVQPSDWNAVHTVTGSVGGTPAVGVGSPITRGNLGSAMPHALNAGDFVSANWSGTNTTGITGLTVAEIAGA